MDFQIIFTNNKNKLNKYIKNNNIKNKVIFDSEKIIIDYDLSHQSKIDVDFFKLLAFKKIYYAMLKNKNIYYIPYLNNDDLKFEMCRLDDLKKLAKSINTDYNFNSIIFYKDLEKESNIKKIIEYTNHFDRTLILEDY